MKKSDIKAIPADFEYFIHLNEDIELSEAFDKSLQQIDNLDIAMLHRIGLKVYAEGKWSINKVIHHVTDWERIWCYRIILGARREGSVPDGHDEQIMADNSNADELPIEQIIAELRAVRLATKAMFENFDRRILETDCSFYQSKMSVLALGFGVLGHHLHHFNILKERYFPLDSQV